MEAKMTVKKGFKPKIEWHGGFIEGYGGPGRHWIKGVYDNRRLFRFDSVSEGDVAVKGERQRLLWEKRWPSKAAFLAAIAKKELDSPLCDNCQNPTGSTGTMCLNKNWCGRYECQQALEAARTEYTESTKTRKQDDDARYERQRLARINEATVGFHWKDGWYFKRLDGGAVRATHCDGQYITAQMTVPAPEWASIVCSVSNGGETGERWDAAQNFHGREG